MSNDPIYDIVEPLRRKKPSKKKPATLQLFLESDITTDRGRWSLEGREPFREILQIISKTIETPIPDTRISLLKAEQIGASTIGIGVGSHLAVNLGYNVGYFLPTQDKAKEFGASRFNPIIRKSPLLRSIIKADPKDIDTKELKQFGDRFFYLRGLQELGDAVSIPLDAIFPDEVDLLSKENLEWLDGRVMASRLRFWFYLSAGYTPGAGIDLRWQEGSQHKFLVKCVKCGLADQCLEDLFPATMIEKDGQWIRVCSGCKRALDLVKNGRWAATYTSRVKERNYSFRLSALALPAIDPNAIGNRWKEARRKKSTLAKFRCSVLAIPDAGAMQPITDTEIARMRDRETVLRIGRGEFPRYAGLDTAGDLCHFWCHEILPGGRRRLVWIEEIDSDEVVEKTSDLMDRLGVHFLIVDKKPLYTQARALAYCFPRRVALQDFVEASELKAVEESGEGREPYRCVKVNRDESLDDFTSEITSPTNGLLIPVSEERVLEVLADHLKNLRKERTVKANGNQVDKYLSSVANHFGMAGNSARIAELVGPSVMPFSWTPIDGVRGSSGGRGWGHARSSWGGYRG